MRTAFLTS